MASISSIFWFMPFLYLDNQTYQSGEHVKSFAYLILIFPYIASALLLIRQFFVSSIFSLIPLLISIFLIIIFHENYGYGLIGMSISLGIQLLIPTVLNHSNKSRSNVYKYLFSLPILISLFAIMITLISQKIISIQQAGYITIAFLILFFVIGVFSGFAIYVKENNNK